jgi:hypothetical protein
MAAFIEAKVSRCYGISSKPLQEGEKELRKKLESGGSGIGAAELLRRLDTILG